MDGVDNSLLKNGRFVRLWIGQGLSFVGDFVSTVALVLLVVDVSGSASAVGGVLVARLLPTLASPLVGVLADRLDRRAVLVAADLVRAVLVVGLIFARDLPVIYALVFLMGAARTVFNPTVRAAFPSVVGGGDLTRANALISGTFSFSMMAGPALGGVLVAFVGLEMAFLLDALTFLVSAAFLSTIPLPAPERDDGEEGFFRELRAGFGYLAGARVPLVIIVGAFLATLTANAAIPAEAFLARDTFDAGDVGYGLLASLWGGGMILGSALVAVLGGRINLVLLYFVSIFATALAFVGVGLSPTFALALGAIAVAGAANGVDNVATDTILQRRVPDAFLGRVFAARFLTFSAGEAFAYPIGGLVVDAAGPRSTYLLAGAATAAAGLLILSLIAAVPPGIAETDEQRSRSKGKNI
ncbi:MAG: MFS transporter [Rubrobacter sp.]|jgi:MFS family permease|nr:MFS transporter [Rubrobacter sp.]MBA3951701.1 MFS transporter [Rubrobacter sp.]MDQ3360839.1 MFS transporter [Actinomycetota bacterium]MDQ3375995.1 MFS transporter [Actinomycetota bacterium]